MSGPALAALAAFVAGLLASAALDAPPATLPLIAAAAAAAAIAHRRSRAPLRAGGVAAAIALLAGLWAGDARIDAIDGGALVGVAGEELRVRGTIAGSPARSDGELRLLLDAPAGRIAVRAREPLPDLISGSEVVARGRLAEPEPWRAAGLERAGVAFELVARDLHATGATRGGAKGMLDGIRERAEAALGAGIDPERAALARGFVLGQDDAIAEPVRDRFRDAGLSHLLAVSGQNVALLAVLIGALLALAGVPLRPRLVLIALAVAAYVPIAGAGASIQRAGLMGVAAIVATLSSRPVARPWVILLAAAGTLVVNPRAAGEIGWQLSFAAVVGIALWVAPIRDRLLPAEPTAFRRSLADAAAVTLAATIATAPLLAHHFETLTLASLPANLLAAVAVAPVMWLGMLAGLLGQFPALPLEPVTVPMSVLIGWIEQVAGWFSAPGWAVIEVAPPPAATTTAIYVVLLAGGHLATQAAHRRRGLIMPRVAIIVALAALLAGVVALAPGRHDSPSLAPRPSGSLRLTALDVGQGDAILLEPPRTDPILIDGGYPGSGVVAALERRGIGSLAAVAVTHGDLDHAGGLFDVLERFEVGRLLRGIRVPRLEAAARASGVRVVRLAAGDRIRLGSLRLDVLWPPANSNPGPEPNGLSLTLLARRGGASALLTGDAEFESAAPMPPPVDVLKVAHHGSLDAGLAGALEIARPAVALISAGEDNDYGHPTPETLATLSDAGVCALRTDLSGELTVDLGPAGVSLPGAPACAFRAPP